MATDSTSPAPRSASRSPSLHTDDIPHFPPEYYTSEIKLLVDRVIDWVRTDERDQQLNEDIANWLLTRSAPNQRLTDRFYEEINSFLPNAFISGEIIDAAFTLIPEGRKFLATNFLVESGFNTAVAEMDYLVEKWNFNDAQAECAYVPLYIDGRRHWVLTVVDFKEKMIDVLDSLRTDSQDIYSAAILKVQTWINSCNDVHGIVNVDFGLRYRSPIQQRDNDCGCFVIDFTRYMVNHSEDETMMKYPSRKRILYGILANDMDRADRGLNL